MCVCVCVYASVCVCVHWCIAIFLTENTYPVTSKNIPIHRLYDE